jgi:uncharacterized membrane protein
MPLAAALGALALAALSLSPSLIPRTGAIQGIVTGLAAATGYGLGLLLAWIARQLTGRTGPSWGSARAWRVVLLAGGALLVLAAMLAVPAQNAVRDLMGTAHPSPVWYVQALVVAVVVLVLIVGSARLVRRMARGLTVLLSRHVPARASRALGAMAAAAVTLGVVWLVINVAYGLVDRAFQRVNSTIDTEVTQPSSRYVSAGPGSAVRWEDLGADGRAFIAGVPSLERLSEFRSEGLVDPIRVYAGVDSSPDAKVRADLAVRDLEAFGAFERSVLLVAASTGTGLVDQLAIEPVELMYGGNTAVVSTQYSHLPSWLSFLVDQDRAREAGRVLFDAVYSRWSALPEGSRPTLLVFGESLGAYGAESAFTGLTDMANKTDGAMLVGPPQQSPVHQTETAGRDPGSPQWQPVVDSGTTLRFGSLPTDLDTPGRTWPAPRLVYLQNASDPVVWWSPELLAGRPDWLAEPRGPDVSPHMRWWPILTFLQLSGDMMDSTSVPTGHGHVYGWHQAAAWARIAPPEGWTDADTDRLVGIYS